MTTGLDMTILGPGDGTGTGTDWAGGSAAPAEPAPDPDQSSTPDDYPPAARPDWLKPFAHVKGTIVSAPLDMPGRLQNVTSALQAAGWTVDVRSVGTDFSSLLGFLPRPKSQPLDLLLNRTDRPYTLGEAQQALSDAIGQASMDYSPVGSWIGEVYTNVAVPTVQDAGKLAGQVAAVAAPALFKSLALVTGIGVLGLIIYLKIK